MSAFRPLVPENWTSILVTQDVLPDSIERAIGAGEWPVRHKPNTAYVQNLLLTVGRFQCLLPNSINNANIAYPTYLWCLGFFSGYLKSSMEPDGVHNLGTWSLVYTVAYRIASLSDIGTYLSKSRSMFRNRPTFLRCDEPLIFDRGITRMIQVPTCIALQHR